MTTTTREDGSTSGWIIFSGIMLILAGTKLFFDGLWALDHSDMPVDTLLYGDDLGTWGWIWLIAGIAVVAAGIAIFSMIQWARWVGVAAAGFAIIANFTWLWYQPGAALVGIILASMVMYGLLIHGET